MHTSWAARPILGQRTIAAATNESATFWPFMEALLREYRRTGLLEHVAETIHTGGQAIRAVVAHWGIESQASWTMDVC